MSKWKSVKGAPKDGTWIVILTKRDLFPAKVQWAGIYPWWTDKDPSGSGWSDQAILGWMPLPVIKENPSK